MVNRRALNKALALTNDGIITSTYVVRAESISPADFELTVYTLVSSCVLVYGTACELIG